MIPFAPTLLVVAASFYTPLLCLINTRAVGVSNTIVAVADGAILVAAAMLAAAARPPAFWIGCAAVAANFLLISLFAQNPDLKAIRDLMAPAIFLIVGAYYGGMASARMAFVIVAAGTVIFALWELLATQSYTSYFDVLHYYIARGVIDPQAAQYVDNSLFVSGVRNAGRTLFPSIGVHRVSSIFLEPVSMGNFGAIAAAIALSVGRKHWRTGALAGAVAVFAIVMADARFATMAVLFFIPGVWIARARWCSLAIAAMPFVVVLLLVSFGLMSGYGNGDDLPTRLAQSGRAIAGLSVSDWLGVGSHEMSTLDSGYYYAFKSLGLPLCIVAWLIFARLPTPDQPTARFKVLVAIYICALLCVSGSSLFALKTSALCWFLLGCLMRQAHLSLTVRPRFDTAGNRAFYGVLA